MAKYIVGKHSAPTSSGKPVPSMPRYKKPVTEDNNVLQKKGAITSPEKMGSRKRSLFEWSVDELIEYKQVGNTPKRLPDPDILYKMGKAGLAMVTVCDLFGITPSKFSQNEMWTEPYNRGKGDIGARIRTSLVKDALEDDNTMAKVYLDKVYNVEKEAPVVQVTVNNSLHNVATEDLIEVAYTSYDESDSKDI